MKGARIGFILAVMLLVSVAIAYMGIAALNGYPKSTDTYYHMGVANRMIDTGSLVGGMPLNAGGTPNPYPPIFHLLLAGTFMLADPMAAATFLGPVLSLLSVAAFYLFVRDYVVGGMSGKRKADAGGQAWIVWVPIVSTFAYAFSVEIVNISLFSSPANLGLLLAFLALWTFGRSDGSGKHGGRGWMASSVLLSVLLALTHVLTFLVYLLLFICLYHERLRDGYPLASVLVMAAWGLLSGGTGASLIPTTFSVADYGLMFQLSFLPFLLAGLATARPGVIAAWLLLAAGMALSPFYPERIAVYSIIPASLLAGYGFSWLYGRIGRSEWMGGLGKGAWKALLLLILMSSLLFIPGNERLFTEITAADIQAMKWIRQNTPEGTVVASTWQVSGPWVVTLAHRGNVLGSFHEVVPDYIDRRQDLDRLFMTDDKSEALGILHKYGAEYVFINAYEESALYPRAPHMLMSMFEEVYGNGQAYVFRT